MNTNLQNTGRIVAVVLCCWVVGWGNPSSAQDESTVLVEEPLEQPQLVPAVPSTPLITSEPGVVYEEMAAPTATEIKAQPVAHIDHDVTRRARKLFGGSPFVELTMVTQNPADGCFYEIPLCLPACCTGEPTVTSYCGLMGRGVVVYSYECGLEVEVKFRLRGDVEVEYGT